MNLPTLIIGGTLAIGGMALATPHGAPNPCQEDAPCWDWSSMGNQRRGIVLTNGTRHVVTATSYCRAVRAGTLDPTHTPRLKGDPTRKDCSA